MILHDTTPLGNYEYNYIPLQSTPEQVSCSIEFSTKCYEARKEDYAKRGQHNEETIIQQIASGKIFEYMIHNYLVASYPPHFIITLPSVEIQKRPTYEPDILVNDSQSNARARCHIKSQELNRINEDYPISWAFQKLDKLFYERKNDLIFMGIMVNQEEGRLLGKGPAGNFDRFLGGAKREGLGSKRFLYYNVTQKEFEL